MRTHIMNYDKQHDILSISFGDTSNAYGDEIGNTIVILRDINTNRIQGVTIIGIKQKWFGTWNCLVGRRCK